MQVDLNLDSEDLPASVGRLVERAVRLDLAAAQAEELIIGLNKLHIVVVTGARRLARGLDVVLSTAVVLAQLHLLHTTIEISSDLNPVAALCELDGAGSDETLGHALGAGGTTNWAGAVREGRVLALADLFSGSLGKHEAESILVLDGDGLT